MIGRHHVGALVTVVDRKSKFTLIKKVESKQAKEVTKALVEMLLPLKPITKTITSDNGKEFAYFNSAVDSDVGSLRSHPPLCYDSCSYL